MNKTPQCEVLYKYRKGKKKKERFAHATEVTHVLRPQVVTVMFHFCGRMTPKCISCAAPPSLIIALIGISQYPLYFYPMLRASLAMQLQ